ncbi:MAG: peptidase M15A [Scytolyngbya sp. HA4215-MV1]|nr:peptidase M15A [Scytolyngbya sp. HA4215-MV1]
MAPLTPDQRNSIYLVEAERTGIHKPILAALYAAQGHPTLEEEETGLGIAPANRVSLADVSTFQGQVHYAANTIRSITNNLTAQGWQGADFWFAEAGRYSDQFLMTVASGYAPPANDVAAARLEKSDKQVLMTHYLEDGEIDFQSQNASPHLAYLEQALLTLVEHLPTHYVGLVHQREALLELTRLWRKLDTREAAIAALNAPLPLGTQPHTLDDTYLDIPLLQFVQRIAASYGGYPHQREGLIRLTQLWRELDSREAAIASLGKSTSAVTSLKILDSVLIALIQRISITYAAQANQRNALVEGFRLWRQLDSRSDTLIALGVNPTLFTGSAPAQSILTEAAAQVDRSLIEFIRQIPTEYQGLDHQRNALIRIAQVWRNLPTPEKTIQTLMDDLKRMSQARRDSEEAAPTPLALILPRRPPAWTPHNLQIHASILPSGSFTWAEATHGGTYLPPNQATVDAIVHIAQLVQQVRDRLGRPVHITRWYRLSDVNARVGEVSNSRHMVGDAIDFYCDGLTGDQIYWFLDPWWSGGLGRYTRFPYLSHIDARGYRARWLR